MVLTTAQLTFFQKSSLLWVVMPLKHVPHLTNYISSAKSLRCRIGFENGMHTGTMRRQTGQQEHIFLMPPTPQWMHCSLILAYPVDIIFSRKKKKSGYQLLPLASHICSSKKLAGIVILHSSLRVLELTAFTFQMKPLSLTFNNKITWKLSPLDFDPFSCQNDGDISKCTQRGAWCQLTISH